MRTLSVLLCLCAAAGALTTIEPEDMCDELLARLLGEAEAEDDVALLIIRRNAEGRFIRSLIGNERLSEEADLIGFDGALVIVPNPARVFGLRQRAEKEQGNEANGTGK